MRSEIRVARVGRPGSPFPLFAALLALTMAWAAGCGGGGGGGGGGEIVGLEFDKPGGGIYISDPHQGGTATRLHLAEMFWARLVDVHDQDANGTPSALPIFRDFPINESVQTDGDKFQLTTNPITQRVRLLVRRTRGEPDDGRGTFADLLRQAQVGMAPVAPKNDDSSAPPPIPFVARNSAIVLRFDDLLQDDFNALVSLRETVRLKSGYPPENPFGGRLFFDATHGGVAGGEFHSTRVIVDLSVSQVEAASFPVALTLNSDGLPPSRPERTDPNVSIRIPTLTSFGTGQFELLRGLSGVPLAEGENGPVDFSVPTHEIVRGMRSGNSSETNNGFLLDINPPSILGSWLLQVENAQDDPAGFQGIDFLIDLRFTSPCKDAPQVSDICSVSGNFLEVSLEGNAPDFNGRVTGVHVRSLLDEPVTSPFQLLGQGNLLTPFSELKPVESGCWVSFDPVPTVPPQELVSPDVEISVNFSEAMDPATLSALERLLLVRGDISFQPAADTIVPATISASIDLRTFKLTPSLPLRHQGRGELYHLIFGTITDLAGNHLPDAPDDVTFSIDPASQPHANGGLVMRFGDIEELPPADGSDLRGQFFFDLTNGKIGPRPVSFQSVTADRTKTIPGLMIPFPLGVQTPLSPLGSKLQAVYRYCDLGWNVRDESKYNIDVVGLSWSPIGGQVVSDFYPNFEIRLSHSRFLPDECINNRFLVPDYRFSGLLGNPNLFTENILNDPLSPQKVVHPKQLGYSFSQANVVLGSTGVLFVPYPLNRGQGPITSFTWRDTSALNRAGPAGEGIPLCIEASRTVGLEAQSGVIALPGQVPTIGLPLLAEYRCYPSNNAIGLNALDISLAINSSALPAFRAYSTGGANRFGVPILVDPDTEASPLGGFNPNSSPPGRRTPFTADNSFYIGQVDYVTRVSRAHSAWIDTNDASPDYVDPIVQPLLQGGGTTLLIEYRGATGFNTGITPFDAGSLNTYGEPADANGRQIDGAVQFLNGIRTWNPDIDLVDGARYLQMRLTFLSDIQTGVTPELDALGLSFSFE
jgi:hypothetical protein